MNNKQNGYFVDLAANHWSDLSNTVGLERHYNWTGICIEANPEYFKDLVSQRKCHIIGAPASSYSGDKVVFKHAGAYSGIVGSEFDNKEGSTSDKIYTTVTLLNSLNYFKAPKVIDYFSLDVEGGEWPVLKNFDFGSYTFLILAIERPSIHLHNLISHHGYRFLTAVANFGESFYLHRSHPNFENMMVKYQTRKEFKRYNDYQAIPHWNQTVWEKNQASTVRRRLRI